MLKSGKEYVANFSTDLGNEPYSAGGSKYLFHSANVAAHKTTVTNDKSIFRLNIFSDFIDKILS
jgi:hypothetical protein